MHAGDDHVIVDEDAIARTYCSGMVVIQAEGVSVLWLLPTDLLSCCRAFWDRFRQLIPSAPEARTLTHPPGWSSSSEPLKSRELGLLALESFYRDSISDRAAIPATSNQMIVLTATTVDLAVCKSVCFNVCPCYYT